MAEALEEGSEGAELEDVAVAEALDCSCDADELEEEFCCPHAQSPIEINAANTTTSIDLLLMLDSSRDDLLPKTPWSRGCKVAMMVGPAGLEPATKGL